jgi:hypothetical protein
MGLWSPFYRRVSKDQLAREAPMDRLVIAALV